jgi:SLT domain-containing protein
MVFDQLVKILIMAPGHVHLVQAATGLVNAVDGIEARGLGCTILRAFV